MTLKLYIFTDGGEHHFIEHPRDLKIIIRKGTQHVHLDIDKKKYQNNVEFLHEKDFLL